MTTRRPAETSIPRQLLVGWRWFDDRLRAGLADAGFGNLTTAQSMLFPFLDREGTRPTDLAARLGTTKQAVHQLVKSLQEQGLLTVVPDPTSARSKLVKLTDRGQRSVTAAQKCFSQLENELAGRLGTARAEQLRGLLEDAWPPEERT